MKQLGFFDVEERLARLSGLGDQLEAFSRTVDFEVFRSDLNKALAYSDGSKGGLNCPGFCGDSKTCEVRRIHEQQIEAFSA
ncbi:transposase [Acetobacter cibinongensis NRIC 0482]|nr:transposase [Acetobacter cibinongensis NRIC 0482]